MNVLEHLNLYFGGEWVSIQEFARDFKEENEGEEEQAIQQLLMFINALNRNS